MTKLDFPSTLRIAYAFANPVLVVKPTSLRDRFMDVVVVVLLVEMMLFMVIVMLAMQGEVMVVLMVFVLVEICLQGGVFDKSENSSCLCCTHLFEKTSNVREVKVCSRLDLSCSADVFGGVSCYCNGCTGGGTGGGGVGAAESDG